MPWPSLLPPLLNQPCIPLLSVAPDFSTAFLCDKNLPSVNIELQQGSKGHVEAAQGSDLISPTDFAPPRNLWRGLPELSVNQSSLPVSCI